jgi:hypothetical protein
MPHASASANRFAIHKQRGGRRNSANIVKHKHGFAQDRSIWLARIIACTAWPALLTCPTNGTPVSLPREGG